MKYRALIMTWRGNEPDEQFPRLDQLKPSSTYLSRIVNWRSCPSRSKAVVPSTRMALILSRKLLEHVVPCRSLRISKIFGWRRKATTFSLYATGTSGDPICKRGKAAGRGGGWGAWSWTLLLLLAQSIGKRGSMNDVFLFPWSIKNCLPDESNFVSHCDGKSMLMTAKVLIKATKSRLCW